jgi:hypothetical protein
VPVSRRARPRRSTRSALPRRSPAWSRPSVSSCCGSTRLFWADGDAGIAKFGAQVDAYARAGLRSEIQVRYHPPEGAEGDIARWEAFVRSAVRLLGPKPAVTGFSITNEANFPVSPNTRDGVYAGVIDALVRGVILAREAGGRHSLDRPKRRRARGIYSLGAKRVAFP